MTQSDTLIKNVAPLANVARLVTLLKRLQNRAHGLPGMGCFYSPPGFGKTTAGVWVTNKSRACHIQALHFGGTKKLLTMIVTELGLKPARTVSDLYDQAVQEFGRTNRPLIIDDAHLIAQQSTIETVRLLFDNTEVPIILMGEELLPQRLRNWAQVDSRIMSWVAAEPATADDVSHLAAIYAPKLALDAAMLAAILSVSAGSLRKVSTNLAFVAEHAAVLGVVKISRADWGDKPFLTRDAPQARRDLGMMLPTAARGRRSAA